MEDISSMSANKKEIITTFSKYRDTLDVHYDQRERIIKCTRDITALSKKIVFALLRITQDSPEKVFKDAETKHAQVLELFRKLSKELQGSDACRYNRQATAGIQEYIEAIGLWHFLQHNNLITMDQVLERLSIDGQPLVTVTNEDYLLGISDLPGEVNRYCINAIGKGDHDAVKRSLEFLRLLKEGISLVLCSCHIKELGKKLPVLNSSLEKIEKTYYSMAIRENELHSIGIMNVDNSEQANII
ncbi:Translin [Coemansia reversa NRRL 1564]|uniref:Translin n=1 Tax=Coemansia reversa (strain ATCC 12441 / NRRL 1564) TaxID=763665 RepID=A0A2G5BHN6_COERN|nr:Translin [Coemansia reversa NRRL 1564]|eukprot:PIA18247.1 Translin [Coemansia reversa NRRL 1564]